MSICQRLFYAKKLGNCIHCTFIVSLVFLHIVIWYLIIFISNTNNLQTDLFDP